MGYWSTEEEDLYRIKHLWEDYKIHPFVMPFDKFDPYQKKLARWCNNKIIFSVCDSYEDYDEHLRGEIKKKRKLEEKEVVEKALC